MAVLKNKNKAFKRGINLHSGTHLMAKALRSRFFKLVARFVMILTFIIVLIPFSGIKLFVNDESGKPVSVIKPEVVVSGPTNLEFMPLLFNEDLFKKVENGRAISSTTNTQRRLLGYNKSEAKRAALKKLEDVLLEPPRASSGTSKSYLKRTKYLPDLLGDSLESYPRRVFIDVGLPEKERGSGTSWFNKNYPTRNLKFEMYKIKTLTKESSKKEWVAPPNEAEIGMSDWLSKNVKEEEYVVMKAEAGVVEDMVKSKAIRLVDELFLECKPKGLGGRKNMSKRAYWECLALYGNLRDEGVAVHQWWG